MVKKRTSARRRPQKRAVARKAAKTPPSRTRPGRAGSRIRLAKNRLTIAFENESDLGAHLKGLSSLFGGSTAANLEAVATESCLSLIQSLEIVIAALAPKTFTPTEKLGDTYLASQERELFRARAVEGVSGAGCQIADSSVPIEESTTHSAVVNAIRDSAHG